MFRVTRQADGGPRTIQLESPALCNVLVDVPSHLCIYLYTDYNRYNLMMMGLFSLESRLISLMYHIGKFGLKF